MSNTALPLGSTDRQLTYPTSLEIASACSENEIATLAYPTGPISEDPMRDRSILGPDRLNGINIATALAMLKAAELFWIYAKKSTCAVSVLYRPTRSAVRPSPAIRHFARARQYAAPPLFFWFELG
jgi:hypothetical protein